jgi:hypothetical protein
LHIVRGASSSLATSATSSSGGPAYQIMKDAKAKGGAGFKENVKIKMEENGHLPASFIFIMCIMF